jgi:hypothetical protein
MIREFFRWLYWLMSGKPCIEYSGFHCGCCGTWVTEEFTVPEYASCGKWADTWGICNPCVN